MQSKAPKSEALVNVLKLRLVVGFLGERSQYGWWASAFFGEYSLRSLEFIAPRTSLLAQYHGVVEAARRAHDENLNVGTFHLFRLPEELEQDLHATMQTNAGAEVQGKVPADRDSALESLSVLAGGRSATGVGPTAVGQASGATDPDVLQMIAAIYSSGFSRNVRTYPYLVG